MKKVLREVRRQNAKVYDGSYRVVRMRQLKVLPGTRTFYLEAGRFYTQAGFVRLGDFRIASMPRNTPAYRTPLRYARSRNGEITADAYYFQVPAQKHLSMGVSGLATPLTYDFTTEFEDGGFIATSNAQAASFIELPKTIRSTFLPPYTPAAKILAAHRRVLAAEKRRGRKPVLVANETDMLASGQRLHRLKCEFREKIGHGRLQEVKAIQQQQEKTLGAIVKSLGKVFEALAENGGQCVRK